MTTILRRHPNPRDSTPEMIFGFRATALIPQTEEIAHLLHGECFDSATIDAILCLQSMSLFQWLHNTNADNLLLRYCKIYLKEEGISFKLNDIRRGVIPTNKIDKLCTRVFGLSSVRAANPRSRSTMSSISLTRSFFALLSASQT